MNESKNSETQSDKMIKRTINYGKKERGKLNIKESK